MRKFMLVFYVLAAMVGTFALGLFAANALRFDSILEQRVIPEWCVQRDNVAGANMAQVRECGVANQQLAAGLEQCQTGLEQCKAVVGKAIQDVQALQALVPAQP